MEPHARDNRKTRESWSMMQTREFQVHSRKSSQRATEKQEQRVARASPAREK
jgi:hypothetical protein